MDGAGSGYVSPGERRRRGPVRPARPALLVPDRDDGAVAGRAAASQVRAYRRHVANGAELFVKLRARSVVESAECRMADPKGRLGVIRRTGGKRWQVPIPGFPREGSVPALPEIPASREKQ